MHSSILALPPETVALILSHLGQRDQVECMRVCRSWYNDIPNHVSDAWNTLQIARDSWPTVNDCMTRCLAHVRRVILQCRPTCEILEKLKHAGCQLTFLCNSFWFWSHTREHLINAISDVTSRLSPSDDFGRLTSRVTMFGTTLKKLTISNMCTSVMDEHELLDRCPNLTHLTLLLDYMYMMRSNPLPDKDDYRPTKLVYLHLDNAFICEHRQKSILARSPGLEMLIISIHQSRIVSSVYIPEMSFISMIDTCPRLQYISWKENEHPKHTTWLPWREPIQRPAPFSGLAFQGDIDGREQVIPLLERTQSTLQYLKLGSLRYSSYPISSIQFPGLRALYLSELSLPSSQWFSLLCGCPNLESLELELLLNDFAEPKAIIQGINSLERLQKLSLTNASCSTLPDVCHLILPNPALRELCLLDMPMSDEGLIHLADLPSLRVFRIRAINGNIGSKGLLGLARKLRGKPLESLSLIHVDCLDDTVLYELAEVEHLSCLLVANSARITDNGVMELITKGKEISLVGCSSVSRNGLWKQTNVA